MAVPLNAKSKEERIREVQMADAADDLAAIAGKSHANSKPMTYHSHESDF